MGTYLNFILTALYIHEAGVSSMNSTYLQLRTSVHMYIRRDRPGSRPNPGPGQNRPIFWNPGPGQNREIYREFDRDF
jgi:hypothetical protein